MISNIIQYWRDLVGSVPSGSESYEYIFASLAALLIILLVFKFLFLVLKVFDRK